MSKQTCNDFVLLHCWYNSSNSPKHEVQTLLLEEVNCQLFLRKQTTNISFFGILTNVYRNVYFGLYETLEYSGQEGGAKSFLNRCAILYIGIFILGYDSSCTYSQLHQQALCDRQNSVFTILFHTVCQITSITDVNSTEKQQRTTFHVLWS